MAQTSFALLTNTGRAKEAAALANATTIEITYIAIGDGATVPSGGETALYNEVARKTISGHGTVVGAENVAYFDAYLAAGDGPYAVAGGTANALTATLTPAPAVLVAGMTLRLMITSDNADAVTLTIPNTGGAKPVKRKDGAELTPGALIAGQVAELIFDGAAWQVVGLVGGSGPMGIERIVTITESTTYVPPPGCRGLLVEVVGGGGSGGGVAAAGASVTTVSGGGGAGGYARKLITRDELEESYVVTIGAAGEGKYVNASTAGGTTSFGSVVSATGGGAGVNAVSGSQVAAAGGTGGVGVGGDVIARGCGGDRGYMIIAESSATGGVGGSGGDSVLGGGAVSSGNFNVNGMHAVGPGGGGGGCVQRGGSSLAGGWGEPCTSSQIPKRFADLRSRSSRLKRFLGAAS